MDPLCYLYFMSVMLSCLFFAAFWSPAALYVMFACVFITFTYDVPGRVWYLIVLIPDPCLLPYIVVLPVHTHFFHMEFLVPSIFFFFQISKNEFRLRQI